MYLKEEKILILGSLFHDVGKFVQRCTSKYKTHQEIGLDLISELREFFLKIFVDEEVYKRFCDLILKHHNKGETDPLINILREADHISASQRVDFDYDEEPKEKWSHIYLSSLFSKVRILSDRPHDNLKYYKQEILTNENYQAMIPRFDSEAEAKSHQFKYNEKILEDFKYELKSVLSFYEKEDDFDSLINLLLVLYEKYYWCIPDFTGNDETDISLYNHIKDTTAIALCLFKSNVEKGNINLIVGDIPGIQKYIFGIENRKAAKMLRGRSIFVQILSRNFATYFLHNFQVPETNLIMLAGGKFYIIVPDTKEFAEVFIKTTDTIQKYLSDNFLYELNFAAGYSKFNAEEMKKGELQFGKTIEAATGKLNENKQKHHYKDFHNPENNYSNLILDDFIDPIDEISDNMKCYLTDKPILKGKGIVHTFKDSENKDISRNVYKQAFNEYLVGEKVVRDNVIIEYEDNFLNINSNRIENLDNIKEINESIKLIINPDIYKILLKTSKNKNLKNLLRNARFFTVANYVSFENKDEIMDFESMSKKSGGAQYLTLLKGDVDELGLIMSYGLERDIIEKKKDTDFNSISRITTLSHHLKYFFSFFINGFLDTLKTEKNINCYTVFAGGDDIMLICHQNDALNVIKKFNETFKEFVCDNPEVHISYSLTHFKHSTPIRLIADFSEENQKETKSDRNRGGKKKIEEMLNDKESFYDKKHKNSTFIFNTVVKNEDIPDLMKYTNHLAEWVSDENNPVSHGILRNLMTFAEMMKEYNDSNGMKTTQLLWHPQLTYSIKRNLKDNKGNYKNALKQSGAEDFFDELLSLSKKDEYKNIEDILYPACCGAIYKLR